MRTASLYLLIGGLALFVARPACADLPYIQSIRISYLKETLEVSVYQFSRQWGDWESLSVRLPKNCPIPAEAKTALMQKGDTRLMIEWVGRFPHSSYLRYLPIGFAESLAPGQVDIVQSRGNGKPAPAWQSEVESETEMATAFAMKVYAIQWMNNRRFQGDPTPGDYAKFKVDISFPGVNSQVFDVRYGRRDMKVTFQVAEDGFVTESKMVDAEGRVFFLTRNTRLQLPAQLELEKQRLAFFPADLENAPWIHRTVEAPDHLSAGKGLGVILGGMRGNGGAVVLEVEPGSLADEMGFTPGDLFLQVDDLSLVGDMHAVRFFPGAVQEPGMHRILFLPRTDPTEARLFTFEKE